MLATLLEEREENVAETLLAPGSGDNDRVRMRQILEIEEHVEIPSMMRSDPFYRVTYLIKEEIRKYKWIEGEKGRQLSWTEARSEWTATQREQYGEFLLETLVFGATSSCDYQEGASPDKAHRCLRRLNV